MSENTPKNPKIKALVIVGWLLILGALVGVGVWLLAKKPPTATPATKETPSKKAETRVVTKGTSPSESPATAVVRRVRPLALLKTEFAPLGVLKLGKKAHPFELQGIGWGRCVGGWGIQGFYKDDKGTPHFSPTLLIPTLEMPEAQKVVPVDMTLKGRVLPQTGSSKLKLTPTGALLGSVSSLEKIPQVEIEIKEPAQLLSLQPDYRSWSYGCFSTGEFTLNKQTKGFVTASPSGQFMWIVRLVLDVRHHITFWVKAKPKDFVERTTLEGDLATIFLQADKAEIRVFFERFDQSGKRHVDPVTQGNVSVTGSAEPMKTPWKINLKGTTFPESWQTWQGDVELDAEFRFPKTKVWNAVPMF